MFEAKASYRLLGVKIQQQIVLLIYSTHLFSPDRGGIYAGFPFDGVNEFEKRCFVRVKCNIEGIGIKCSSLPMGEKSHAIHKKKELRKRIGKKQGDEVRMIVEQDLSPRIVVVPEDMQWFLDYDLELKQKFNMLSTNTRKTITFYINEAKTEETRAKRIYKMLKQAKKGFNRG